MATYYWVGGSGTWDSTSTTNWASSSGGGGGAGVPTLADDVIFDAASNVATGAFTVTIGGTSSAPAVCRDFSTGGAGGALDGAMTLAFGSTGYLDCYGSMTIPAANFSFTASAGSRLTFKATTTGKTFTTNGVAVATALPVYFDGVGGEWTLGSALTANGTIFLVNGSLITNNFNVTGSFSSSNSNVRSLTLGSSTWTSSGSGVIWDVSTSTNMTLSAGTSTISGTATSQCSFRGGGLTYYNLQFTGSAANSSYVNGTIISGTNTFNNLTFTSRAATGWRNVAFFDNQTINGTLTFGTANTAIRRMYVQSSDSVSGSVISSVGKQITLTVATLAAVSDVDFRDIVIAGVAAPLTGTRIGDRGGCSGITFTTGVDKYWNLAGGGNWSSTAWALGSGGGVSVNNFPLPQDNVIIEETGLNSGATITLDDSWQLGNISFSTRTSPMTWALAGISTSLFGNIVLSSAVTTTATSSSALYVQKNGVLDFTSNTATFNGRIVVQALPTTFRLLDNMDHPNTGFFQIQSGKLDLNTKTLKIFALLRSSSVEPFTIDFNSGKITCTRGTTGNVVNVQDLTSLTISNASTGFVELDNNVGVGTRTILWGNSGGRTEARAVNFKVINGTDSVDIFTDSIVRDLDLTGFGGTLVNRTRTIYGNLILSGTATYTAGSNATTFAKSSGTQQITCNGKTVTFPLAFSVGAVNKEFLDAFATSSSLSLVNGGNFKFKEGVTHAVATFVWPSSEASRVTLSSLSPGNQWSLSSTATTVNAVFATLVDSNATGSTAWNAYVDNDNIDGGNNDGWDFGISPIVGAYEYTYSLRSFTQPKRF